MERLKQPVENDITGIPVPEGWQEDYWLGRPVWLGMCQWKDYYELNISDLIDMHRSLNLKQFFEYEEMKLQERK